MWPFKPKTVPPDWKKKAVDEFRAFREIGATFKYLGRTCIVTRLWALYPYIGMVPELHADYADEGGVLRSITFRIGGLPGLKAQNPDVQG